MSFYNMKTHSAKISGPCQRVGFSHLHAKTLAQEVTRILEACAKALSTFLPAAVATTLGIGSSSG